MSNFLIEKMVDADLEEVSQIFVEAFNHEGESWGQKTAQNHVKENFFGEAHFVAKLDGEIVGFVIAFPLTRETGLELFIDSIAVLPEHQHKGIGKALWEKLMEHVDEQNFSAVRLLSNEHLSAYRWYKKMGFRESGWVELYRRSS